MNSVNGKAGAARSAVNPAVYPEPNRIAWCPFMVLVSGVDIPGTATTKPVANALLSVHPVTSLELLAILVLS